MPRVIRVLRDNAQSHGYSPLGMVQSGSTKVITNGSPTARDTDPYTPGVHCLGPACHGIGTAVQGSPNVFVEGLAIHRDGDLIACGTVADNGSPDVFANGSPQGGNLFDGDGGGGDFGEDDWIGYVAGQAIVEYLDENGNELTLCSGTSFSIAPYDGHQHAGYLNIHQEDNDDPQNIGPIVGRTYSNIGLYPPNADIPPHLAAPAQLKYEANLVSTGGDGAISIDETTGVITGRVGTGGHIAVRATHFIFDDEDEFLGTQGPWWDIPVIICAD